MAGRNRIPLLERFLEKVNATPGCWLWTAGCFKSGYGGICVDGKMEKASRVAYRLFIGEPGPLHVLHTCDNTKCVRPTHLFLGTPLTNSQDKVAKGRQSTVRGEQTNRTNLTEGDVRRLRADPRGPVEVSLELGISCSSVINIRAGRRWAHVV